MARPIVMHHPGPPLSVGGPHTSPSTGQSCLAGMEGVFPHQPGSDFQGPDPRSHICASVHSSRSFPPLAAFSKHSDTRCPDLGAGCAIVFWS